MNGLFPATPGRLSTAAGRCHGKISSNSRVVVRPRGAPVRLLSTAVTKWHDAFVTNLSTACANLPGARIDRPGKDIGCHVEVTGGVVAFTHRPEYWVARDRG